MHIFVNTAAQVGGGGGLINGHDPFPGGANVTY
jgi:hypothetical protein